MTHTTKPDDTLRLSIAWHPFAAERVTGVIPAGQNIADIIATAQPDTVLARHAHVYIDGHYIPHENWAHVIPKSGTALTVRMVPMGGGGGGKNPLRTVLSLAVMAASPIMSAGIASAMGVAAQSTFLGMNLGRVIAGGVSLLSRLALNAIAPPGRARFAKTAKESPTLFIQGARNDVKPFGRVPKVLGRHRMVPPMGALPYTETVGNDQYLRMLFVWGYGPLRIGQLKIGETPLAEFDGVEIETREGYDTDAPITLYSNSVLQNDLTVSLTNADGYVLRTSEAEAGTIWLDDAATPWLLKAHDGSDWITIGAINASTNSFTPYQGAAAAKLLSYAADTGSANAYATAPDPAISAYTTGQTVFLKPANANTGASTIAVSGLTAKSIKLPNGSALPAFALLSTGFYVLVYDGTNFVLSNPSTSQHHACIAPSPTADLDTLTTAGFYITDGSSYTNGPLGASAHTGAMHVYTRSASPPTTSAQIVQKWVDYTSGEEYMRCSTDSGSSWSAWAVTAYGTADVLVDRVTATYTASTGLGTAVPGDDTIPQKTEGTEILSVSITPKSVTNRLRVTVTGIGSANATGYPALALFLNTDTPAIAASCAYVNSSSIIVPLILRHEFVPGTTSSITLKVRAGASAGSMYMNGVPTGRFFGGTSATILTVEEYTA